MDIFFSLGGILEGKTRTALQWTTEVFFSIFISVDGMMGKEAQVLLANLSRLMASKMDEPNLHV